MGRCSGDGRWRCQRVALPIVLAIATLLGLAASPLGSSAHDVDEPQVARHGGSGAKQDEGIRAVVVNGVPVPDADVRLLERHYSASLPDGRYWYDRRSGLWGVEAGPATGQIHPWLELGGPMAADASSGDTGVFINGREIHVLELEFLRALFGEVPLGRYWLDSTGVGGLEGLPASFDIGAAASGGGAAAGGGYIDRGPFGTMGGDGDCFYFNSPDVPSYLSPEC